MAAQVIQTISLLALSYTSLIDSANSSLICDYHGNCLCPDDVLTFVCRVSGLGAAATVWTGSILFNCPNSANEVILRHRRFEDIDGVNGVCNDGEVVAYSIEATNNSYISRLNVTVSPEMKNGDVQCIQEGPGTNSTSVGACPLKLTFSSGE